ncbi:MAG: pseudouridine synthase [Rhodoplanes sp.]
MPCVSACRGRRRSPTGSTRKTSGCLVLGRHRKALAHLGLLFKHGKVGKTYWAVVEGGPDAADGVIDLPLARLDATRGWWMKPDPKGMPSVTRWRVMGRATLVAEENPTAVGNADNLGRRTDQDRPPLPLRGRVGEGGPLGMLDAAELPPPRRAKGGSASPARGEVNDVTASRPGDVNRVATWLALEPLTGRTHQLRVHCAAMGWPITGDNIYGTAPRFGGPGLHLHAREIVVPLGKNREPVRVVAPIPAHMRDLLCACGFSGE